MRVLWIIDNKFRELYGLYDLKIKLQKHNIKLLFFSIPVWKSAIDFINPNVVVVPNLMSNSCGPLVNYAIKKKIRVFCHSAEGMYYAESLQKIKYPIDVIKKISKVMVWGKLDAQYLIKQGFKNKVVYTGCLKFDKKNYKKKNKKNKNIKVIGIPTHSRVFSGMGISKQNIPYLIRELIKNNNQTKLGFIKLELEYIETIIKLLGKIKKKFRIIFKVSPFEDPKIYTKAFPEHKIHNDHDVRNFLKETDVILNVYSSIAVDALKYNIPTISLDKFIHWDKDVLKDKNRGPFTKNGAIHLGIIPKNFNKLSSLLEKKVSSLLKICKKKKFYQKAEDLAGTYDSLDIMTKQFLQYQHDQSQKSINYLFMIKYLLVEVKQLILRQKRAKALYRPWSIKDRNLLKSFRF